MKRSFYAKLLIGAALLQTASIPQGISCLGTPVQGAPIYSAENFQAALAAFLAQFGL